MSTKFMEGNSLETNKKRNDSLRLPLIIKIIIVVFLLLVFIPLLIFLYIVKTPLLINIVATIIAIIFYLYKLKKYNTTKEIFLFLGIKYEIKDDQLHIDRCLNITLEFCEKFATVSALITFTIVSSLSKLNSYSISIGGVISAVLSFFTVIMYFHYLLKFSFYLLIGKAEKHDISTKGNYFLFYFIPYKIYKTIYYIKDFLQFTLLMIVFILTIWSMLFLGLEFVPQEQLFCHTNELKTVLKIIGSNICN